MNTIMTAEALNRRLLGDTDLAAPLSIASPGALYAGGFLERKAKKPESELLPPFGRETAEGGRT